MISFLFFRYLFDGLFVSFLLPVIFHIRAMYEILKRFRIHYFQFSYFRDDVRHVAILITILFTMPLTIQRALFHWHTYRKFVLINYYLKMHSILFLFFHTLELNSIVIAKKKSMYKF